MSDEPKGAILQRDKLTYAIVPRTPCGLLTPDVLDAVSRVCRKYEVPIIKITSGQRLALVGMKKEAVEPMWEELRLDVGRAVELCVHYVQACPGTAVCRFGLQDSLGIGVAIEEEYVGHDFPAKVKFGISGCPFCCGESYLRDVGLVGTKKGWTLIVGGNSGGHPRIGDVLAEELSTDEAKGLIRKFMEFYRDNSGKRLRVSKFVEKTGIEAIRQAVLG
ncbi:nitrite/sulfite reductase domain-containing protein [Nitratidesulfovibrio vulgaris]|uniref:Sulfite reductase, assimilatory-type n=2 Tax=Nitratidesulfovibrio vulgaris TaxID=881 RepID=SIR_NITV2|nr:NAD(P)/FAD-dependent oxidoreductase [Nitratidesulfovibrio vulgaris]Q05805.2 RecName: Full=Sulfite reductase, assimilatory-type [Nitratidesulfovibrio vulgaris str. Hildenborough]GEB79326.1 sulfite reductase, assimilatory-type [Desulfovibrio desulfuricans]HBW16876.1 NAD(P)/FAD-dependent oxidoreductase [Desulfovibrio sp.]AAS96075.1 sulfite reductase, assimilatory-type [Nitratidesulfovibrio vulgaris str. Hildenborough]ABM28554.1 nitrite and sulphite reductase 4Fe-4S region [Nitratidesulfovibrio